MDFLKGLNAEQREAVAYTDGPLLILAGAGSGKTRVITHRVAHIVTTRHVPPSAVLAVTFTNKAANEMRERISSLLEDVSLESAPNVSTFHSFCVRMLRRDGDPLARVRPGFTRRFTIYDDEDQLQIIKADTARSGSMKRNSCNTARRFPASATLKTHARPRLTSTSRPSTRKARRLPPYSRNTKRRCATPTRSTSTTCCWRPSGCCKPTTPPAKRIIAG